MKKIHRSKKSLKLSTETIQRLGTEALTQVAAASFAWGCGRTTVCESVFICKTSTC
jgi:hypothetical protein